MGDLQFRKKQSRFNLQIWRCKDYDAGEYIYFDGNAGSADTRFVFDLQTDSMEGLRDVRPVFFHFGFWSDQSNPFPPKGDDSQVEAYFVTKGRQYLLGEWIAGRGFFAVDRDWKEVMEEDGTCMPWEACKFDPIEGDVGCDGEPRDIEGAELELHYVLKTNMRVPLFDQQLLTPLVLNEKWDQHIVGIHINHPIYSMVHKHMSIESIQYEMAKSVRERGYLKQEAMYVYPNPNYQLFPAMSVAEAKEHMAKCGDRTWCS